MTAREVAEKIAADARMRLVCMKPEYDTIDLGESLITRFVEQSATPPVPAGEVGELVEQVVSAWAFAHNIDGAARNDLFTRLRAALSPPCSLR